MFLHGRGADEFDLIDLADHLPRGYTYASVRAPVALPEGGYTWFDSRGPARPIPASLAANVRGFRTWLDEPALGCSSAACFLVGFSAGMMMAGALLLDDPARFAGAVLLSGALALDVAQDASPGRLSGVPIFYGHGTLDAVIPAPLVMQTEVYLREHSGALLSKHAYPHAHAISQREVDDIAAWFAEPRARAAT